MNETVTVPGSDSLRTDRGVPSDDLLINSRDPLTSFDEEVQDIDQIESSDRVHLPEHRGSWPILQALEVGTSRHHQGTARTARRDNLREAHRECVRIRLGADR